MPRAEDWVWLSFCMCNCVLSVCCIIDDDTRREQEERTTEQTRQRNKPKIEYWEGVVDGKSAKA